MHLYLSCITKSFQTCNLDLSFFIQNKANVLQVLRTRLYDIERQQAASERDHTRRLQVLMLLNHIHIGTIILKCTTENTTLHNLLGQQRSSIWNILIHSSCYFADWNS
jgi:hypothetical protein